MFASMVWIITTPINDVQNDRVAELAVGGIALVAASRRDLLFGTGQARWISLHLPRQSLISHLGIESEGGCAGMVEALASRLCFRLVQDAVSECDSSPPRPSPPAAGDLLSSWRLLLGACFLALASWRLLLGACFSAPELPDYLIRYRQAVQACLRGTIKDC
jgi:hypothetical protein